MTLYNAPVDLNTISNQVYMKTGNCNQCGKPHTWSRNSHGLYCSNKCQSEYQRLQKITSWLEDGIAPGPTVMRGYLKEQQEGCYTCGITSWCDSPITLELDHIDGNALNNSPDNLRMLCPNCHSQTPTYKNKNKGNGRVARRERANNDYKRQRP